jgi:vacuolar-type H+-ATPase subunit F/Vma7
MSAFSYVGSEIEAAAFRLAGAACWSPASGEEVAALRAAQAAAEVVFLDATTAARLPRADLDAALASGQPLLVIVPALDGERSALDPAERVRAQLGLER